MWNLIGKKLISSRPLSCRRRLPRSPEPNRDLMSVAKKHFAFIELYGAVNGSHHATVSSVHPSLQDVFEFILRFFARNRLPCQSDIFIQLLGMQLGKCRQPSRRERGNSIRRRIFSTRGSQGCSRSRAGVIIVSSPRSKVWTQRSIPPRFDE
jgi:hypothetical protein